MGNIIRIFFNNNRYEQSTPTGDPAIDNGTYGGYVIKAEVVVQMGASSSSDSVDAYSEPDYNSAKNGTLWGGATYQTSSYVYLDAKGQVWYCFGAHQWVPGTCVVSQLLRTVPRMQA